MRQLRMTMIAVLLLGASLAGAHAQTRLEQMDDIQRRPMTFEDMYAMGRVADPQISPDGSKVLYTVTTFSLEANTSNADIWVVDIDGKNPTRLTDAPKSDAHGRWSPDGSTIAFVSSREGTPQVWMMDADGRNQRRMTSLTLGATGVEWSPSGRYLVFVSEVHPDCAGEDCNKKREEARTKSGVKAIISDRIPYRIWNSWKEGKFSHAFVMPAQGGVPQDVTPGAYDTPPVDLGGHVNYAIAPDDSEIAYVKNTDPIVAISTNNDIWIANLDGSNARCITTSNKANDNNPVYSPDGRFIAYRAMRRAGYEADKYDLMVYDRAAKTTRNLTADIDRSVDEILWKKDGSALLFTAQDGVHNSLFEVPAAGGDVLRVLKGIVTLHFRVQEEESKLELGTTRSDFRLHPDGKTLVFVGQRINHPAEIMSAKYEGEQVIDFRMLTSVNRPLLDSLDLPDPTSFTFKSFDGTEVQGWILNPPGFDPKKKYPMIYLVHGGPQGVWGDDFHYRWNMQLFASPGFVVVAVNPRGSTGFGQAFTDGVNGNWGGTPYKDLMTGLDFVLKKYPHIDKDRVGAAGASYGGYMMSWFLGNTKRFKAIFNHAGVYDLVSMYGGTEELWFTEWEFQGTPWTNPKMYEKWSPSRLVKNFSTPTYVSHGQLDYRVPVEQGMQLFTALQRRGIESKFLYFPDEGHTVLKPRNSQLWYGEFAAWFKKHLMR